MPDGGTADAQEVVCAILGGESSERAAHVAVRLAERLSLNLALIDVHVPIPPPQALPLEGPHPVLPSPAGRGLEPLTSEATLAPDEPPAWRRVLVTPHGTRQDTITAAPATALARLADDGRTALLVVGDDGGGALWSKLEGNAGRDALRDVRCPLVLVPAQEPTDADRAADVRTLVCGVDDDDRAPAVAAVAAGLAGRLGGRLHFVHVLERAASGAAPEHVAADELPEDGRYEAERLFARCQAVLPANAAAAFVTMEGDPADALLAAARDADAGFLVVGRPAHGALVSALLGSATHELLREGATPVVVVPSG